MGQVAIKGTKPWINQPNRRDPQPRTAVYVRRMCQQAVCVRTPTPAPTTVTLRDMADTFDPNERARQKAEQRIQDELDMQSGKISPEEMQRINGGGDMFRNVTMKSKPWARAKEVMEKQITPLDTEVSLLQAEVARLRAALSPFAEQAQAWLDAGYGNEDELVEAFPDMPNYEEPLRVGNLVAARIALKTTRIPE